MLFAGRGTRTSYIEHSVHESEGNDATIMPNPASESVWVTLPDNTTAEIVVFNSYGTVLYSRKAIKEPHLIGLGNMAEGVYFIRIRYDNGKTECLKLHKTK